MTIEDAVKSLALSRIAAPAAARSSIPAGSYHVDTTVRISGTVRVGEDYDTAPTVNILNLNTLGHFIQYCGITREVAMRNLRLAAIDAMNDGESVSEKVAERCKAVKAMVDRIQDELIASLPRQARKAVRYVQADS